MMEIEQLSKIMQENGIVGAGGAGFPSYAKLNTCLLYTSDAADER